jgi:hypothetical protein
VVRIFAPPVKSGGTKMDGSETPDEMVNAIVGLLKKKGVR